MNAFNISSADKARFLSKIKKPTAGCWMWRSATSTNGYGSFWMRGRGWRSHRVMWMIAFGTIPDGMSVLHECDEPLCVRPDHLFLGTQMDNMKDAAAKGRCNTLQAQVVLSRHPELRARGERMGAAKLTNESVRHIRSLFRSGGITQKQLASDFKISHSLANQVINRKIWTHI